MTKYLPRLYAAGTTDFTNNGFGCIADAQSVKVTEKLNGAFELEMYYPINGAVYNELALNRIIYAPPNPYDAWQPFRIYSINRVSSGIVKVNAEHIFYELIGYPCLPNDQYAEDEGTCVEFLAYLSTEAARTSTAFQATAYTFSTAITDTQNWKIEDTTDIKTAMALAVKYFGGEWKINGRSLTLLTERGADRGVKVMYGSNLQSLDQAEVDTSFTHIMPYWSDGTTSVYVSGYYIAVSSPSETAQKRVLVVNLTSEFDEEPAQADLATAAAAWLADNPPVGKETNQKIRFVPRGQTVEYAHLGDIDHVELGDTVSTADNPLNVDTTQRVITTVYDIYRGVYESVELGAPKASLVTESAKAEEKRYPTVWVSPTEPEKDYQSGDYWIKINDTVHRIAQGLGRYSGGEWKLLCEFGSGGVGEFTNDEQNSERFNDYTNNSSTGQFNHVEGRNNVANGGSASSRSVLHVEGENNTVSGYCVHCEGQHNTVTNANKTFVSGDNHTINGASQSAVLGGSGSTISGTDNIVGGSSHTVPGNGNAVFGNYNRLSSTYYNFVSGQSNEVSGWWNLVSGTSNDVSDNGSAVFGIENEATKGGCVVGGQRNNANAVRSTVFGWENTNSGTNSLVTGDNNTNSASEAIMCGNYGVNQFYRIAVGGGSNGSPALVFYVDSNGATYAAGGYTSPAADYAEYFEWADGNPKNEDRRGMLVQLVGDKIAPAHGDDILGIISACPSVVGNAYGEHWRGKYKRDIFGAYILDENGDKQISEDYDKDREYIPRSQRQEWAAVGLLGQLVIRDNGKCQPGGYVEARQGIGVPTFTETKIRCMRRIDETHCMAYVGR